MKIEIRRLSYKVLTLIISLGVLTAWTLSYHFIKKDYAEDFMRISKSFQIEVKYHQLNSSNPERQLVNFIERLNKVYQNKYTIFFSDVFSKENLKIEEEFIYKLSGKEIKLEIEVAKNYFYSEVLKNFALSFISILFSSFIIMALIYKKILQKHEEAEASLRKMLNQLYLNKKNFDDLSLTSKELSNPFTKVFYKIMYKMNLIFYKNEFLESEEQS